MSDGIEVNSCSRCRSDAIVHQVYSGQHLCGKHLAESIRKRTSKELRSQLELPKNALRDDGSRFRILIAISGGKDSAVLLSMMADIIGRRRDVELIAGCVDEGIDGYRAPSITFAKQLSESLGIRFESMSYQEMEYGRMDQIVNSMPSIAHKNPEANGLMPCSYCGVFRRQSLNSLAEKLDVDVMALGHNLDDMAQSILMNLQKGEVERSVRLAPHTKFPIDGIVPRIVPLRWIPEQEIHAHAIHSKLPIFHGECPHAAGAMRQQSRLVIAKLEAQTPGARHGLLHSLDQIRELHSEANPLSKQEVKHCCRCGEITSRDICQSCTMKEWIADEV